MNKAIKYITEIATQYFEPLHWRWFQLFVIPMVLGVAFFLAFSDNKEKQEKANQDEISKILLVNVAGEDGKLTFDKKRDFVRYLGFADAVKTDNDTLMIGAEKGKFPVFINGKRLGTFPRQQLEAYFYGRQSW